MELEVGGIYLVKFFSKIKKRGKLLFKDWGEFEYF